MGEGESMQRHVLEGPLNIQISGPQSLTHWVECKWFSFTLYLGNYCYGLYIPSEDNPRNGELSACAELNQNIFYFVVERKAWETPRSSEVRGRHLLLFLMPLDTSFPQVCQGSKLPWRLEVSDMIARLWKGMEKASVWETWNRTEDPIILCGIG